VSYTAGQCTAYVAAMCPWIPDGLGDARTWAQNAAALGFPIYHVPAWGRVAQWPANYGGAEADGHVAVVNDVTEALDITVTEENWTNGAGVSDSRNIPAGIAAGLFYIGPKANPLPTDGVPMTTDERLESARAHADQMYFSMGHRAPESPQARDGWALIGVNQGIPQMIEQMAASPEFSEDAREDYARDHTPGA
jgi:hypothetical protein